MRRLILFLLLCLSPTLAWAQAAPALTSPDPASGALTSYLASAASTNATSVKGSPGNVYAIRLLNTTSTQYYLRMYNLAAAPTCSSATGFVEIIPAAVTTVPQTFIVQPSGQSYSTGIAFCFTGAATTTDTTNAATGIFIVVLYR